MIQRAPGGQNNRITMAGLAAFSRFAESHNRSAQRDERKQHKAPNALRAAGRGVMDAAQQRDAPGVGGPG